MLFDLLAVNHYFVAIKQCTYSLADSVSVLPTLQFSANLYLFFFSELAGYLF